MSNLTKLIQRRRAVRLAFTMGLALLFTTALLWGLGRATLAHATPTATTRYVDGSSGSDSGDCSNSASPCATIQYAINQSASNDDILITQGTYTENLTINISVTLEGGYEATNWTRDLTQYETIIDGDQSGTVLAFQPGSDGALLDGFTVTGGNVTEGGMGGGITIDGSSPTLQNVIVVSNNSTADAGGIYISGGSPTIISSEISGNSADGCCGGIHVGNNATTQISDTMVLSNTAGYGGGIGIFSGSVVDISSSTIDQNTALDGSGGGISANDGGTIVNLSGSTIRNNFALNGQSGGIDVRSGSTVNVVDSIIADNTTRDHGGAATIDPGATLNLTNALVTGNSTTSGNANAFGVNSNITIMNSTISDNNPQGAQAVILWSGHLTITNSIMWNNALSLQGDPPCPTCFTVTYSDIEGGWTGTGNINADPLFVDATNNDYHLKVGSPCVDKGTLTGAPVTDIEGTPRDAAPDMGAYEWTGFRIFLPLTLKNFGP